MSGKDELLAIAEIAVTLVGFSGLIFVFRARSIQELEARDLSALAMIVGTGAMALAFALLPLPLSYLGLTEAALWRTSSGCFGAALLAGTVAFLIVNRRLAAAGHRQRTPRLNRTSLVLALLLAALLALAAIGLLPPGPAAYLLALVVCVLLCLTFVAFMLVVARRSGAA